MRDWVGPWISRWRTAPDAPYAAEFRRLNSMLRGGIYHWEVISIDGQRELTSHVHVENGQDLLALIGIEIARFLTTEDAALLRHCAGKDCTLWFVDRTKGHRRLFCSAAICGNRAKVAAFRARQKEE